MIGIHYITSNTDKYMVNNVYGLSGQALHQYLLSCLMKTAAHIKKKKKKVSSKKVIKHSTVQSKGAHRDLFEKSRYDRCIDEYTLSNYLDR